MSEIEASEHAATYQTKLNVGQQLPSSKQSVKKPSSLIGSMQNHAQSTWDSWGRLKKGTWLRWLHDMGQTVTEDVSAEARLARGIPSRATKV
jgi:hypothetical protein